MAEIDHKASNKGKIVAAKPRRKEEIVVGRKSIFSLFLVTCIFLGVHKPCRVLGAEDKLPREIEFRRYFSSYNFSIDWEALVDLKNNPILNACMEGATSAELESLQIPDLAARLQKLQSGNLIRKIDQHYHLNFPAIIGNKRAELEKLVDQVSLKLLPITQKMTQEIAAHLKGQEQMLYHVVWSIIMDGQVAWITLDNELKKQLGKGDVSITGTSWWKYPNHPYRAGTNSYGDLQTGQAKITWSPNTPMPPVIYEIIKRYEIELIQSTTTGKPVEDLSARQALAKYGLVDGKGIGRVYIIDPSSETAQVFGKFSQTFGKEFMKRIDVQEAAKMLGVTPVQALLIVYHELCYELLEQLAIKGILEIPEVVLKPNAGTDQTYRLISIIDLTKLKSLDQLKSKLNL
jgi:hypothetical protein